MHTAGQPLLRENRLIPTPSANQLSIKVLACGVCRTDLHLVNGELPQAVLPRVLGHEIVGEVMAVGTHAAPAVSQAWNWAWRRPESTVTHDAQTVTCPACRRIEDQMPAATVTLSGNFLLKHRNEIINLIENTEKKENAEHALERIINLGDSAADLIVTTIGIHLANRLGHALEASFKESSDYQCSDDEYGLSVNRTRNG